MPWALFDKRDGQYIGPDHKRACDAQRQILSLGKEFGPRGLKETIEIREVESGDAEKG